MIKAYVIGSLTQSSLIKKFADQLLMDLPIKYGVRYVYSQPDKDFQDLVKECYDNIEWADIIYVIKKKDGTIGNGVTYELEYAKRLKKQIVLIDTKDYIYKLIFKI